MNKKKVLLSVVALLLVCALSVVGTLALLKLDTTDAPVTNTFIAAGGGKLADSMTLNEHKVVADTYGDYFYAKKGADDKYVRVQNREEAEVVTSNSYTVMPGMILPKDPTITITGKTTAPAFLYVEVVGALNEAYEWEMADGWTEISGLTGAKQGKVYVYKDILTNAAGEPSSFGIINENKITVPENLTENWNNSTETLTFYAYLAQTNAGGGSAEEAYEATFLQPADPTPNP